MIFWDALPGASPQTKTLSIDCSRFTFSFPGTAYGISGPLIYTTYLVEDVTTNPGIAIKFVASMASQFGPSPP